MMPSLPEQTMLPSGVSHPPLIQLVPQATRRGRLFFLDHLRATLTILVVFLHLAAAVGVPLCFALAFLVRKIPFTSRLL